MWPSSLGGILLSLGWRVGCFGLLGALNDHHLVTAERGEQLGVDSRRLVEQLGDELLVSLHPILDRLDTGGFAHGGDQPRRPIAPGLVVAAIEWPGADLAGPGIDAR